MSTQLDNLRAAHVIVTNRVIRSLRTQVGDVAQLSITRSQVLTLLQTATQHRAVFSTEEFATLQQSIDSMVLALDEACHRSSDPPDASPLTISHISRTGRRGRPRVEIDASFLSQALDLRGPTGLRSVFHCSPRTIRRRALEHGLVTPGHPVYTDYTFEDGSIGRSYTSSTRPVSVMTDEQLDSVVREILEIFPLFGRRMLTGRLKDAGHNVPRKRLTASYLRVHGTPGQFGDRTIHRRVYSVAGANSLAHHDGQHGLIRFKMVIHAFVDGKSRFVTGIRVSNNNRAQTVLDLFLDVVDTHGVPSRVRGDHGTENLLVAEWMEEHRGVGRGSYIWGRSVHNTRSERLWFDVMHGFGLKWKNFFLELEVHHGLNPRLTAHIWLLHHLFLDSVDQDAQQWAATWNFHPMEIRGERTRSPRDMFLFSLVQDGPRGIQRLMPTPPDEVVEDPASYGIDWEVMDSPHLMNHLLEHNPQDWDDENPFTAGPPNMLEVKCEPPNCPFTENQVDYLDQSLSRRVDTLSGATRILNYQISGPIIHLPMHRPRRNVTAPRRPDDPFSFTEVLHRKSPQPEQTNLPAPLNIDTPIPSTDVPTAGDGTASSSAADDIQIPPVVHAEHTRSSDITVDSSLTGDGISRGESTSLLEIPFAEIDEVVPVIPQDTSVDTGSTEIDTSPQNTHHEVDTILIEEQSTSQIIRQIRELQNVACQRPHGCHQQRGNFRSGGQDNGTSSDVSHIPGHQPFIIGNSGGSSQIVEDAPHSERTVPHRGHAVRPGIDSSNSEDALTPVEAQSPGPDALFFIGFRTLERAITFCERAPAPSPLALPAFHVIELLVNLNGPTGRQLRQLDSSSFRVGTSHVPVSISEDFANYQNRFEELGQLGQLGNTHCLWPTPSSEERTALLSDREMDPSSPLYVLYCYHQDINLLSVQPVPTPVAPVSQTQHTGSLDTTSQLREHLSTHFPQQHTQIIAIRSGPYKAAYSHCATARLIVDMCESMGIIFGRTITPAHLHGIPTPIFPHDVAACYSIVSATFGTMRTHFSQATEARRILSDPAAHSSSLQDRRLLDTLNALLGTDILDPDLVRARVSGAAKDAVDMSAATLDRRLKNVIKNVQAQMGSY